MTHREEYAPLLSAFVDGELNEAEREALTAHLDECEDCRAALEELLALRAAMEELPELNAPAGFAEGVMARVRAEKKAKRPLWRRYAPGLAACAAIVALTAAVLPQYMQESMKAEQDAPGAYYEAAKNDEAEALQEPMLAPSDGVVTSKPESEAPQSCESMPAVDQFAGNKNLDVNAVQGVQTAGMPNASMGEVAALGLSDRAELRAFCEEHGEKTGPDEWLVPAELLRASGLLDETELAQLEALDAHRGGGPVPVYLREG